MNSINDVKKATCVKAEYILSNGIKVLESIECILEKHFSILKLSDIEEKYEEKMKIDSDVSNKSLIEGIQSYNDMISQIMDNIQTLERFISLHVPQMEDGNNFGVTVQLTISKFLDETRENLSKQLEKIPSYFCNRAEAVEKLDIPKSIVSETKTITKSQSTGGKDGDENKSSESSIKEERTSISKKNIKIDYRRKHLLSLDVQLYRSLRCGLINCYDSYLTILDNMEKNREKLLEPKGQSGGANLGMY